MMKIASSVFIATLLVLCLHVASAQAQYVRTCVSMATGNDLNTCHCSQPCRTFARAHAQTFVDGEITVLDPGDYGGLTITKSISINNDSTGEASISVSGGSTGIIVSAPNGAGYVNLRGITIQGVGFGGGTGLRFNTGFALTMTHCVVRNHTGNGIEFLPNASSSLAISNTLVADNGGAGVRIRPTGSLATMRVSLSRVEAYNNSAAGISVEGDALSGVLYADAADSVTANNQTGFAVSTTLTTASTTLMLVRSVAANNGVGLSVSGDPANLWLGNSSVHGNTLAWSAPNSGRLFSYGDNNINGNANDGPLPQVVAKK